MKVDKNHTSLFILFFIIYAFESTAQLRVEKRIPFLRNLPIYEEERNYIKSVKKFSHFSHGKKEIKNYFGKNNAFPYEDTLKIDFSYIDRLGDKWTAPKGTLTDGASIPDFLILFKLADKKSDDVYSAAIIHDFYAGKSNAKIQPKYPSQKIDSVSQKFFEGCLTLGMNVKQAKVYYLAVYFYAEGQQALNTLSQIPDERLIEQLRIAKKWIKKYNPPFVVIRSWGIKAFSLMKLQKKIIGTPNNPNEWDSFINTDNFR